MRWSFHSQNWEHPPDWCESCKVSHNPCPEAMSRVQQRHSGYPWWWCPDMHGGHAELRAPGRLQRNPTRRTFHPGENGRNGEEQEIYLWWVFTRSILMGELFHEFAPTVSGKSRWKRRVKMIMADVINYELQKRVNFIHFSRRCGIFSLQFLSLNSWDGFFQAWNFSLFNDALKVSAKVREKFKVFFFLWRKPLKKNW